MGIDREAWKDYFAEEIAAATRQVRENAEAMRNEKTGPNETLVVLTEGEREVIIPGATWWQLACFASYVAGVKVHPEDAEHRYHSDLRYSLDELHADAMRREIDRFKYGYSVWFTTDTDW